MTQTAKPDMTRTPGQKITQKIDQKIDQTPGERHLAIKLIKRFGYHESIRQCLENKWHGTLEHIKQTRVPVPAKKPAR